MDFMQVNKDPVNMDPVMAGLKQKEEEISNQLAVKQGMNAQDYQMMFDQEQTRESYEKDTQQLGLEEQAFEKNEMGPATLVDAHKEGWYSRKCRKKHITKARTKLQSSMEQRMTVSNLRRQDAEDPDSRNDLEKAEIDAIKINYDAQIELLRARGAESSSEAVLDVIVRRDNVYINYYTEKLNKEQNEEKKAFYQKKLEYYRNQMVADKKKADDQSPELKEIRKQQKDLLKKKPVTKEKKAPEKKAEKKSTAKKYRPLEYREDRADAGSAGGRLMNQLLDAKVSLSMLNKEGRKNKANRDLINQLSGMYREYEAMRSSGNGNFGKTSPQAFALMEEMSWISSIANNDFEDMDDRYSDNIHLLQQRELHVQELEHERVLEWAENKYADMKEHMTADESAAVDIYTTPLFRTINNSLRGISEKPMPDDLQKASEDLTNYLDKQTIEQEMTVYRGTGYAAFGELGRNALANLKDGEPDAQAFIGQTIRDKGFLSTTISPTYPGQIATETQDKAEQISGMPNYIIMKINVPKGAKAAYIAPISKMHEEEEMLFKPGANMVVTNATYVDCILHLDVEMMNES